MKKSQAARVVEKINAFGSDERIVAYHKKLHRISRVSGHACFWILVVGFIDVICCATIATAPGTKGALGMGGLLAIAAAIAGSVVTDFCTDEYTLFQPLADSDKCEGALALVRAHEVARAVRDDALSRGRQLYVADAVLMEEVRWQLFQEESDAEREEERRAQCAELHGLSEAPL